MADRSDMPAPRRRRVAEPTPDPMASPAPTVAETASQPRAGGRRRAGEPTVSVFIRTAVASKERFEAMADEDGTTARALFEKLIVEEWQRRHAR